MTGRVVAFPRREEPRPGLYLGSHADVDRACREQVEHRFQERVAKVRAAVKAARPIPAPPLSGKAAGRDPGPKGRPS